MQSVIGFKDFYYLEEGVITDTILNALKRVKSYNQVKKVLSYFKLDKQKILKFLAFLKTTYMILYVEVFENLKTPERLGRTALGERDAPPLAVIIAWLVIEALMIPLSVGTVVSVGDMLGRHQEMSKLAQQIDVEVDNVVETTQDTPTTTTTQSHTSTAKQPAVKKSKWSRYTDPNLFITIVKSFEAGDHNTPLQSAKPLKTYHDRTQQTIGFGTKARAGESTLSTKEANKRLIDELNFNRNRVREMLKRKGWNLNEVQINGLTDFAFNRGDSALSIMIQKAKDLNSLSREMLATTFMTTPEGKKVHSNTITARREWEVSLLMSK
jgi:GH24 family phage-related lysozyme (muramidase)